MHVSNVFAIIYVNCRLKHRLNEASGTVVVEQCARELSAKPTVATGAATLQLLTSAHLLDQILRKGLTQSFCMLNL